MTRRPKFFAGQWSSFSHAVQQDCQSLKRHQFSSENLQRMTKWRLLYFQGQQAQSHCRRRSRCGMGICQKADSSPWTLKDGRKIVVVHFFCLLYAFFLRPHCTGLAGLLLIEIKFYDADNNVDDILLILCKREPALFWREKIAVVILLRVLETFKFKTRTTTRTRFCQYLLVRTREPALFWWTPGQTW